MDITGRPKLSLDLEQAISLLENVPTTTFHVFHQEFTVEKIYEVEKEIGQGAYGIVWCVHASALEARRSELTYVKVVPNGLARTR